MSVILIAVDLVAEEVGGLYISFWLVSSSTVPGAWRPLTMGLSFPEHFGTIFIVPLA